MQIKWNSRVGHNDVVLHLGDLVCFGDRERHPFWLDGLHGQKYLIRGNHDQHSDAWYEAAGFQVLGRGNRPFYWTPGPHVIAFSHEPLIDPKWAGFDVNIHGHIHANELWHSLPGHWYENVSVEVVDYAPVQLSNVIGGI
jgi:calcineurin-like phosphoesterase family protein